MPTTAGTRPSGRRQSRPSRQGSTAKAAPRSTATAPAPRTATLNTPFVTAQFRVPEMHLPEIHPPTPDMSFFRERVEFVLNTAKPYLPSREQALYFGGLSVMAAIELIDWPVAVAIAVGNALVPGRAPRSAERSVQG